MREFPGIPGSHFEVADGGAADVSGLLLTVAFWGRWDGHEANASNVARAVGKNSGAATSRQYELGVLGADPKVYGAIGDAAGRDLVSGVTTIALGSVHHYALRKNGTGAVALALYLDGVLEVTGLSDRLIQNTAYPLIIGNHVDLNTPWDGTIGELGIWNTALNTDEIAALAKGFSPLLVRVQNLVGYWPLLGNSSPEPDFARGQPATMVGTVAKADHCRVYMPSPGVMVA